MFKRLSFKSRRSSDVNEVSDERRTMIEKEPYRPLKSRENGRPTLSNLTRRTFGKGHLRRAVQTPSDEDVNEWIAANAVDFYNELSFLYGYVVDDAERFARPGEGFPPNVEYRWPVGGGKTLRLSSPEYVEYAFTWMEDTIDNEEIFPVSVEQDFPDEFVDVYARKMFKLMFRIFAILFHQHFETIEILGGAAHINTCFKHFVFFILEHDLVPDEQEILAARSVFERYRKQYEESAP